MNNEIVVCGVPFGTATERDDLALLKEYGVSSVQIYTFWKDFEPKKRGDFDWSYFDRQVSLIKEAGLKYVPFILMGPKYAAPDWWLKDNRHKGLVCLEHTKESPIESIWNKEFRSEVTRVLEAFADHYLPWNVIQSIQPGICGDYGEAIFPVTGNWPGAYHTHRGFWCGGSDAIHSFRQFLVDKYSKIEKINSTWGSHFSCIDEIKPFLRHKAPSRTAFMDMLLWYRGSMTEYADFWMRECRRIFKKLPVYLCTGGVEEPEHGSCFSAQAKIAASSGGGIRLTNEGNNFYDNFYLTAHMHTACEFYGAYMGLEPVGPMLPKGVLTRTFGSITYGNRQIFHYFNNIINDHKPNFGAKKVKEYANWIVERKNEKGIAFFWPLDEASIEGENIPENIKSALSFVRKRYPVSVINEEMIQDGALKDYKLLIMLDVHYTRENVLKIISDWAKKGGVVLSNFRTTDIEGINVKDFDEIFGILHVSEEAIGHSEYLTTNVNWAEKFNSIKHLHSSSGWINVSANVIPLAVNIRKNNYENDAIKEAYSAFENNYLDGKGIFYSGPLDLNAKEDAIFTPSKAFEYLLEDCCRNYSGLKPFQLEEGEIAQAAIDNKIISLKDNEIIFK